jgi:site-specific DNA recombinase
MNGLHKKAAAPPTKRAVLYARVSSDDRGKDGRNLAGQLEMCRTYARDQGWEILAEVSEDDRGASGASFELPGLNQVLEMAQAGEFDVLVPRELDRLSRNLAKQLIVEEELKRCGVEVDYALGNYDDTPEGQFMKNVRAVVAEYERLKINERMTRGRFQKAKAGHVLLQGRSLYGYRAAQREGKSTLQIHEPEARIVRLIYEWYAYGDENGDVVSIADVTRRLTEMAVPTRGDSQSLNKKRGPGEWSRATVHRILKNEAYAGVWYYGKTCGTRRQRRPRPKSEQIAVSIPSIVSREMWEAVRARLLENRNRADSRRKHDYLVGGRVTCGDCGLKMRGGANGRAGARGTRTYYSCTGRTQKLGTARECNAPTFRSDHVDAEVWHWIKSFLIHPEVLEHGLRGIQKERDREQEPMRARLHMVDQLLSDKRQRLDRLVELYLSARFDQKVLEDHKAKLDAQVAGLERERAALVSRIEAETLSDQHIADLGAFAEQVAESFGEAETDFASKRRLVEQLDVRVTLTAREDSREIHISCLLGQESVDVSHSTGRWLRQHSARCDALQLWHTRSQVAMDTVHTVRAK